jgi:hypothetical protein
MQLRAPRLLPTHGCSFVIRFASYSTPATRAMDVASCSAPAATPMDTTLCSASAAASALLLVHTRGPMRSRGPPSPAPLAVPTHETLATKDLRPKQMKHLQHTLAT